MSYDHATAFQPRQQSETLSQNKKTKTKEGPAYKGGPWLELGFWEGFHHLTDKNGSLCLNCMNAMLMLLHMQLIQQNSINKVAYKQQNFISHSSGGWDIQDQGTGRFSVW